MNKYWLNPDDLNAQKKNETLPIDAYCGCKKSGCHHFLKKIYFSHNRNQDFTNFTTEGFKGYLMPDKFRKNKKFCLNNRMHFTYLCSLYFYINLFNFM